MLRALLLLGLVGCRGEYAVETFAVDHADVTCALIEDCAVMEPWGYESAGVCMGSLEATTACGEAYDDEAALRCVEEVAAMSCDDLYAGNGPASCETACPGLWAGMGGSAADTGG